MRRLRRPELDVALVRDGGKQYWVAAAPHVCYRGYGRSINAAIADVMTDEARYRRFGSVKPPRRFRNWPTVEIVPEFV